MLELFILSFTFKCFPFSKHCSQHLVFYHSFSFPEFFILIYLLIGVQSQVVTHSHLSPQENLIWIYYFFFAFFATLHYFCICNKQYISIWCSSYYRHKWNCSRGISFYPRGGYEVRIFPLILLSVFYTQPHVRSFFGDFDAPDLWGSISNMNFSQQVAVIILVVYLSHKITKETFCFTLKFYLLLPFGSNLIDQILFRLTQAIGKLFKVHLKLCSWLVLCWILFSFSWF